MVLLSRVDRRYLCVRRGLQVIPGGRTARLERAEDGRLVANADTVVTDEMMFAIIDSGGVEGRVGHGG